MLQRAVVLLGVAVVTTPVGAAVDPAGCGGGAVSFPSNSGDSLTCAVSGECQNCNVQCAASQPCAVVCTASNSCSDMSITCPDNSACSVDCTTNDACSRLNIRCPTSSTCTVTCSGLSSCSDMVITQLGSAPGASLDVKCTGSRGCERVTAACPAQSRCDVLCKADGCPDIKVNGGTSGDMQLTCEGNGCHRMRTTCPATTGRCGVVCSGGSACLNGVIESGTGTSGELALSCGGSQSCSTVATTCPGGGSCVVECKGFKSCYNARLDCPATQPCALHCSDSNACEVLQLTNTKGGTQTTISCLAFESCSGLNANCGQSVCSRQCVGSSACISSVLDCSQSPSCHTNCDGPKACHSNTLQCAAGYVPPNSCGIDCKQFEACHNTNPTGAAGPATCQLPVADVCSPALQVLAASQTATPGVPTTLAPTPAPATPVPTLFITPAPTPVPTPLPPGATAAAPPTLSPPTLSPGTTALPSTPSPDPRKNGTAIPEEYREAVQTASTAGSVAGLVGASGAGTASRLAVLKNFGCQVEDVDLEEEENLDWEFHPARVGITHNGRKYMTAAMVLNPLILVAVFGVLFFVTILIHVCLNVTWHQAAGNARSPGLVYIPYLFLLQGTSLVAARLAFYPRGDPVPITLLAAVSLLLCVASPFGVYFMVLRKVETGACQVLDPKLYPREGDDPTKKYTGWKALLYRVVYGEYVWVTRRVETCFVEKFGVVFEGFKQGLTWFSLVELGVMLTLSLLSAWHPAGGSESQCNARNMLICLLFAGFLALLAYHRPYTSLLDNVVSILLCGMMFGAVLMMSIGIWTHAAEGSAYFAFPVVLLIVSAYIVLAKCIWDIGTNVVDIWLGRRAGAREIVRKQQERLEKESFFKRNPFKRANNINMNTYAETSPSEPSLCQSLVGLDYHQEAATHAPPMQFKNVNAIVITCEAIGSRQEV